MVRLQYLHVVSLKRWASARSILVSGTQRRTNTIWGLPATKWNDDDDNNNNNEKELWFHVLIDSTIFWTSI